MAPEDLRKSLLPGPQALCQTLRWLSVCLSVRTTELYSLLNPREHRPELWQQSFHLGRSPDSDKLSLFSLSSCSRR